MSSYVFRYQFEWPYFRVVAPPEYVNMTTLEIFQTLDWTDEAQRQRYQEVLLDENTYTRTTCVDDENAHEGWVRNAPFFFF